MTETQTETFVDGVKFDAAGRPIYTRQYSIDSQYIDGRTLTVRVVPFDEIATVSDPPDFQPYQEQFMPGVFDRQMNAATRIRLRSDHDAIDQETGRRKPGLVGVVANGIAMRENHAGVDIDFRFLPTAEADTALELVRADGFDGVSAEFVPMKDNRTQSGIVQRVKARLDSVALAIYPAYTKAAILALREAPEVVVDATMLPPAPDRELIARCAAAGIRLPDSMAALLTEDEGEEQVA